MNIAFISLMVPDHLKQFVNEYEITPMEEVSSFIQAELIKGLAKNGSQISVFNKLHIREYPKGFKKIFICSRLAGNYTQDTRYIQLFAF